MFKDIDLSIFPPEREQKLKSIYRFSMFGMMKYRSNNWMHTHRVLWLIEEILPLAQKYLTLDPEKARILALVHDDVEIITGDIPAGHKVRMNADESKQLLMAEEEAIQTLTETYPKTVHSYSYKGLLMNAVYKDCIEAKLVSYIDKIDAYCESLHELFSGNSLFLASVISYTQTLMLFSNKFPELEVLLKSKDSPLTFLADLPLPQGAKSERYASFYKPWTEHSIKIETDIPFFNTWKSLIMARGHIDWLIKESANALWGSLK